jgi:hypothetical protein
MSYASSKPSKFEDFTRIRDLMHSTSRASLSSASLFAVDGELHQSTFLYDIRGGEAWTGRERELRHTPLSVERFPVIELDPERMEVVRTLTTSASQTCAVLAVDELDRLRNEFIPWLECRIDYLDSRISISETRWSRCISLMKRYTVFEIVNISGLENEISGEFFMGIDSLSIDLFKCLDNETPSLSIPLRGSYLRVSSTKRDLLIFSMQRLIFLIHLADIVRIKKLIFSFKLLGLPVGLIDVPADLEVCKPFDGESFNPRRHSVRDP